jgi:O-antigen/teichoic acid export membrane protein
MHVSGAGLLWFAYSNSDFAAAGALLGPIALGYYALAFQLVSLPVQKISAHVNQIMFPVFCRLQDDRARARDWFLRLTVLVAAVTTPALVGMALVADDGLPLLLGERWRPAVLPLQMLCPIGAPMVLAAALLQMIGALGRPDVNLKYTALSALLYPAAFFAAGSWLGVQGICLVWLVLYPVQVAALVHLTRGLTGIPLPSLLRAHAPVIAGTGFMAACVLLVQAALADAEPAARLAAAICAGIAAYLGWLLLAARSSILADVRGLWRELRGR